MKLIITALMLGGSESLRAIEPNSPPNRHLPHPRVATVQEGISLPKGQALPTFAKPAEVLDTIEVQSLSRDEQIAFSTLQGLVNPTRPRLYLLDARSDEGRDTWANTATVGLRIGTRYSRDNKYDLVAKYAGEIEGVVLYDPAANEHHRNLAGTVAGLHRALPVTADILARLRERGIELKVVADLTTLEFTSALDIYKHLLETYWDRCEKRLIVSAQPDGRSGDYHHTRDLAAAVGAAVVWLDNRDPEERAVMRRFFADMKAGEAVVLGWYTTERSGVTTASEFGIGTLPADHYISSTVYSGTDHRIRIPAVPRMPALHNKAYVALFISDGDNIQYAQRAMRRIWDRSSTSRGQVPLNWTIAPGLVDIGPGLLNYYYTTATSNDCFVSGPSGMGYLMPVNTLNEPGASVGVHLSDSQRMDAYARLTETYVQRAGLRVATIWDDASPMHRASYATQCRSLYGATVHNFKDDPSVAGSTENDRLRFDKLVEPYVGSFDHLERSLTRNLRRRDRNQPAFFAYQVSVWGELKPHRLVELQERMREEFPEQIEFVRADHYFNLYNQANGLPYNLVLAPHSSVSGGTEPGDLDAAVDGSPSTVWTSAATATPQLVFDFGEPRLITRYVIRHAGAAGMDAGFNTRDFNVQVRIEDEPWTTVDVRTGNTADVTDVDLSPVKATGLRIRIIDPGGDSKARVAEVEIFGRVSACLEAGRGELPSVVASGSTNLRCRVGAPDNGRLVRRRA